MFRAAPAALLLSAMIAAAGEPNLLAELGRDFATAAVAKTEMKPTCIREWEQRTLVTGSGTSTSTVSLVFIPCDDAARAELRIEGTVEARLLAEQGPFRICTDGFVRFTAAKQLCINEHDVTWGCAKAHACPSLTLLDVTTKRQGCLEVPLSRFAERIYYRKEDESHAKFGRKSERKIENEFNQEAGAQLARASKAYRENLLGDLTQKGIRPQELRWSSSADNIFLRARLEGPSPTNWAPVPSLKGTPDIGGRLHQSLLNNAAAALFSGKTRTGEQLEKDVNFLIAPSKKKVELDPEDKEEFSVTFAEGLPIETNFVGGKIKIAIRTRGFVSGERVVSDPFLIEATYDLTLPGEGFALLRQGEVSVQPPDVAAGQREISAREVTLSVVLRKRFNKLIPEKVAVEKIELPGEMKKLGNLIPTQADSDNGWLTIGLNRSGRK